MRPGETVAIPARKLDTDSQKGFKAFSKDPQTSFKSSNDQKNQQTKTDQRNPWGPTFRDRQHFVDMHFN
ncbi:hypothetical protein MTO96_010381 [Rhipicephalus appendiculatus]